MYDMGPCKYKKARIVLRGCYGASRQPIPPCQDCSGGRIRVVLQQKSPNGPMDPPAPRTAISVLEQQRLWHNIQSHGRSTKKGEDMTLRNQRLAEIREHIKAESSHNMKALLAGMTSDCFNDVAAVPKPFRGPKRVAERYRKHWAGFPDFKVRVKRLLAVGENTIVTENEWSGTHLGKFLGYPPTGKYVKVRALVVWHFKGKRLWGETVFFDMGRVLNKIGARITIPRNRRKAKRRD